MSLLLQVPPMDTNQNSTIFTRVEKEWAVVFTGRTPGLFSKRFVIQHYPIYLYSVQV